MNCFFRHLRGVTHADIQPGNLNCCSQLPALKLGRRRETVGAVDAVERLDREADKWAPRVSSLDPGFTLLLVR